MMAYWSKAKFVISTWNCSAKPVMPFPGMVFFNRFTLTLRPAAGMSVSPQVMSSSSASWMKMYWGCMCGHITSPSHRPRGCACVTYQWLYHESPFGPHVAQELIHIHCVLLFDPLQHAIKQNEGARPSHTSTAVYQQGAIVLVVSLLYSTNESNEGSGKLGHSMIRPGGEVILGHLQ